MPLINVTMFPGRTEEQKRELVRELTDAFARTCDANPDGVWVTINEVPPERWAVGGRLISDR
ncbi:2-hydroxymuconate tautomerase [Amycolatopsis nigrescens]|uniref:2-hydroxymuconate tautomerase n=1 Tax=Amycolatopsis nigrescens TaxID=381445 RepID=UPI0003671E29|nr:2-hydroxymuconate tautomerase [Amycolatopsis nigrescens]